MTGKFGIQINPDLILKLTEPDYDEKRSGKSAFVRKPQAPTSSPSPGFVKFPAPGSAPIQSPPPGTSTELGPGQAQVKAQATSPGHAQGETQAPSPGQARTKTPATTVGQAPAPAQVTSTGQAPAKSPSLSQNPLTPPILGLRVPETVPQVPVPEAKPGAKSWCREDPALEPLRDLAAEYDRVIETLQKQEQKERLEVHKRADELHKKHPVPIPKPFPCLDEQKLCISCLSENKDNPLKCHDAVKAYSACAGRARQSL